jgi:glycosyltransferase involved in cell wall biosynthesis
LKTRRRALVLFEYATLNGGEHSFLAMAPYLQLGPFDLSAGVFEAGPLQNRLKKLGIQVAALAISAGASQAEKRSDLSRFLSDAEPHLIHANSLSTARLAAPVAAALKIPLIGHLRDIARISRQAIDELATASQLIAVSNAVRNWYIGLGIPSEKITTIYNGVDLEEFSPGPRFGPVRDEFKLNDAMVIIGIGQLGLRKGFDTWLTAADQIAAQIPRAVFLIAGEQHSQKEETTRYVEEQLARSKRGNLKGRVRWLGRRDDVASLLRESDLLLHAARQEPLGRVLLEGLAVGVPIVATRVGGTDEILPPQVHALSLAEADDAVGLAQQAITILSSKEKKDLMKHFFPEWAARNFSAIAAGRAILACYESVCAGAAAPNDQDH